MRSLYHCSNMRAALQRVGNSHGVIIPKPILAQVGFEREVDINVEAGTIVLRKPNRHPRHGWADASRALAGADDDALVWPEFGNEGDAELTW
jgi:antitoxin MazE